MQSIKIIDKNNKNYTINIDEDSFEHKIEKNGREKYEIKFLTHDENGIAGQGKFIINCNPQYAGDDISDKLIQMGVHKLKKAIDDGKDIMSIAFNFNIL